MHRSTRAENFVLSSSKNIVVVAPDLGLRQSLTFALEVEGFTVTAYESWGPDKAPLHAGACLIIDDQVVRTSRDARLHLLDPSLSVILLTDGISPPLDQIPRLTLAKPFDGADLLGLVRRAAMAA